MQLIKSKIKVFLTTICVVVFSFANAQTVKERMRADFNPDIYEIYARAYNWSSEDKAAHEEAAYQSYIDFLNDTSALLVSAVNNANPEVMHVNSTCVCGTGYCSSIPNINFDQANFADWDLYAGTLAQGSSTPPYNFQFSYSAVTNPVADVHTITWGKGTDQLAGFPVVAPGGLYSVKLGNKQVGAKSEYIETEFCVDPSNPYFTFDYAVVLQDPSAISGAPPHASAEKPFFEATVYVKDGSNCDNYTEITCLSTKVIAGSGVYGFSYSKDGSIMYKDWSKRVLDLSSYQNQTIKIRFKTGDCMLGGHFGYAYLDASCLTPDIKKLGSMCPKFPVQFSAAGITDNYLSQNLNWTTSDGHSITGTVVFQEVTEIIKGETLVYNKKVATPADIENPAIQFASSGTKTVTLQITSNNIPSGCTNGYSLTLQNDFEIEPCDAEIMNCDECIQSFAPVAGEEYIVSAWVKEHNEDNEIRATYVRPAIRVNYNGPGTNSGLLRASGPIIDGWQKIEQKITIPQGTGSVEIELRNDISEGSSDIIYFDDIRFFPVNGNMKSFVYDPVTRRLMAELDENNYASFYEYDKEGQLVRVKKETEKGVMTIKESRTNLRLKTE